MSNIEEILKKLPKDGFLKVSQSKTIKLPKNRRVALIRKGNELFNNKSYDLAKKIFLTTGYTDGLVRLGDYYIEQKMPLEAFRMYWLAPYPKKVNAMLEKVVSILKAWLNEEAQDSG